MQEALKKHDKAMEELKQQMHGMKLESNPTTTKAQPQIESN